MKWQDVSEIAKKNGFTDGHDDALDCPVLDEDKVSSHYSLWGLCGDSVARPMKWTSSLPVLS